MLDREDRKALETMSRRQEIDEAKARRIHNTQQRRNDRLNVERKREYEKKKADLRSMVYTRSNRSRPVRSRENIPVSKHKTIIEKFKRLDKSYSNIGLPNLGKNFAHMRSAEHQSFNTRMRVPKMKNLGNLKMKKMGSLKKFKFKL